MRADLAVLCRVRQADLDILEDTGQQKSSRSHVSEPTSPADAEENDVPSGHEGVRSGGGEESSEAIQAATLFEKLPFELICEVSHVCRDEHHNESFLIDLPSIFRSSATSTSATLSMSRAFGRP